MQSYIVNNGVKPFDYTLKELHEFNISDYLCKRVIIEYWKSIDIEKEDEKQMDDFCVFEGVISCISSKGQLRLQYIDILSPQSIELQHKYLPNPFYHSYWFSFKLIQKVYLVLNHNQQRELQDITNKLLNGMKFKIAQSFIFYCGEYSPISQFCKKNIKKFIDQNYKYDTKSLNNYINYHDDDDNNFDMEELKSFIERKLKYLPKNISTISSSLPHKAEDFLYDVNRSNAHLLFVERESLSRNKQRQLMRFNTKTLMIIVTNYIILWKNWVKGVESNPFQKRRKKIIKQKLSERKEHDEWADYIDWDESEISANSYIFDILYVDLETSTDELYNTTPFTTTSFSKIFRLRVRDGRRNRNMSRKSRFNGRRSQRADHYWKYVHSREYINNKVYVNTKEVATFARHGRRGDKKRCKYKKYTRKVARSQINKQVQDEWDTLKQDELDELVWDKIQRGNSGKMIVDDKGYNYTEIIVTGYLRQFGTEMLCRWEIVKVVHKYTSISLQ